MKKRILCCAILFWSFSIEAYDYTHLVKNEITHDRIEKFLQDFSTYVYEKEIVLDHPYRDFLISKELMNTTDKEIKIINKIVNLDTFKQDIEALLEKIKIDINNNEYEEIIIGEYKIFSVANTETARNSICLFTVIPIIIVALFGTIGNTDTMLFKAGLSILAIGSFTITAILILNCIYCSKKALADEAITTPNILENNKNLNKYEAEKFVKKNIKNFKNSIRNFINNNIEEEDDDNKYFSRFKESHDYYIKFSKKVREELVSHNC